MLFRDLFDNIDGVEFTHQEGCLLQVTDDNVIKLEILVV